MGYFDGLTDASFKKSEHGQWLFYPHGIMGKGYVVTEAQREEFRSFLKTMYMIVLPAILLAQILIGAWLSFTIVAVFIVWYFIKAKNMTKGLPIAAEKLKISEAQANSASSHSLWMLIVFTITSLIMTLGGVLMMEEQPITGTLVMLFFGLCTLGIGRMTYFKLKNK